LFKQHHEKVEKPKGNYKRYEGQGGDEYYAHKEEKGESNWKFVATGAAALGVVGLTIAYVNY
jgi:stalled ribosome alternative rescue factor ArfA